MVTILGNRLGNLGSIQRMLKKLGSDSRIATSAGELKGSTRLILPGVGAFGAGMRQIQDQALRPALEDLAFRSAHTSAWRMSGHANASGGVGGRRRAGLGLDTWQSQQISFR